MQTETLVVRFERLFLLRVRYIFLIFLFASFQSFAQVDSLRRDTTATIDSLATDSLAMDTLAPLVIVKDTIKPLLKHPIGSDSARFINRPFVIFTEPIRYTVTQRQWLGKDDIFYTIVGLLLFFAFIKNSFRRYVGDLFRVYFRTSMRQKQLKEHLLQNPLASLLFNVFFVLSGAVFVSLIFRYYHLADSFGFLALAAYAAIALACIYAVKFLSLKMFGWIFQSSPAADTYIFIVFTTNKIIGITVLPVLVLMGFTSGYYYQAGVFIGLVIVAVLFVYRYYLSYITVNSMVRISFLHFVFYVFAFEVLPLLLINKLLFLFLSKL